MTRKGMRYQNTGASESAYALTMAFLSWAGRADRSCGERLAVELPASAGLAPKSVNVLDSASESRLVKMVPKTATPRAAPTSRK